MNYSMGTELQLLHHELYIKLIGMGYTTDMAYEIATIITGLE